MDRPRGRRGILRKIKGLDKVTFERPEKTDNALENYSCLRKYAYRRVKAIDAALLMAEKHGVPFVVYECPFCGHWHIGKEKVKE